MKKFIFLFSLLSISFLSVAQLELRTKSGSGVIGDQLPDTLTVGYYVEPPFVIKDEDGTLHGISIWLWERIAEKRKLTFKYQEGTLKTVLEGVSTNRVDIGINSLSITAARVLEMDFSHPFFVTGSVVALKQQSSYDKPLGFLSGFFSMNFFRVVGALILLLLLVGVVVWLFERKHNYVEFGRGYKGIFSGLWWSAVTMTTVGYGDKSPRTLGGRAVALVWMFASIIVISSFTASITSSLTANKVFADQHTIADFKESKLGHIEAGSTGAWLKRHFFKRLEAQPTLEECLGQLQKGKVDAVVHSEPVLNYMLFSDSTYADLTILPIRFNSHFSSFAFSQALDDVLVEAISEDIVNVIETMEWQILMSEYKVEY